MSRTKRKGMMFGYPMKMTTTRGKSRQRTLLKSVGTFSNPSHSCLSQLTISSFRQFQGDHSTTLFSLISLNHTPNLESFWKETSAKFPHNLVFNSIQPPLNVPFSFPLFAPSHACFLIGFYNSRATNNPANPTQPPTSSVAASPVPPLPISTPTPLTQPLPSQLAPPPQPAPQNQKRPAVSDPPPPPPNKKSKPNSISIPPPPSNLLLQQQQSQQQHSQSQPHPNPPPPTSSASAVAQYISSQTQNNRLAAQQQQLLLQQQLQQHQSQQQQVTGLSVGGGRRTDSPSLLPPDLPIPSRGAQFSPPPPPSLAPQPLSQNQPQAARRPTTTQLSNLPPIPRDMRIKMEAHFTDIRQKVASGVLKQEEANLQVKRLQDLANS